MPSCGRWESLRLVRPPVKAASLDRCSGHAYSGSDAAGAGDQEAAGEVQARGWPGSVVHAVHAAGYKEGTRVPTILYAYPRTMRTLRRRDR